MGDEVEFIWDKSAGVGGAYNADMGPSTKVLAGILKPKYNFLDVFFGSPGSEIEFTTEGPASLNAISPSSSYTEPRYLLPAISHSDSLTLGGITASSNISASGTGSFGYMLLPNLPTSDPGVAGAVFRSGNDLKISTG